MKIALFGINNKTKNQTLTSVSFDSFVEKIKNIQGNEDVLKYRESYNSLLDKYSNSGIYGRIKDVCTTCEYYRKASGEHAMRAYNGVICIEVGELSNKFEVENVKRQSALIPQTLAAFEGTDGHSVMILAQVTLPNSTLPKEETQMRLFHAEAYRVAVLCYSPTLSHNISIKEPKLDATFKMTYDAAPFVNEHAIPFIIEQPKATVDFDSQPLDKMQGNPISRLKPGCESMIVAEQVFNSCYREAMDILREGRQNKDCGMTDEVTVIAKVCASCNLPEEETTQHLLWHYYKENPIVVRDTVRTVYSKEENLGYNSYMPKKQIVAIKLREFLKRRYDIRFNKILGVTEYRVRHSFDFVYRELSKRDRNTIRYEAALEGIEAFDSEINGLIDSNYTPEFNPISDYLNNLGNWDGKDRITEIANLVPCDNGNWPRLFMRWFLSMVAHWMGYDPEHGNSTAPILIGAQGYRKSTFCRILLPPELRGFFTDSIDFRTKVEAERMLSRFLLINIDEFDQLSDNQFAFIKHLFQKPQSNIREMYSPSIIAKKRYASFIGTSNHKDVLRDPTGNRRFICIDVTAPIKVETAIDYKQLYAQAIYLIQKGERYWINDEDEALIKSTNKEYEVESPLELIIRDTIRKPEPGEDFELMKTTDIMSKLQRHPSFNKKQMNSLPKLGRVLTKMNIAKKRKSEGWYYEVVIK